MDDVLMRAIIESIIASWWEANYSRWIYPYIENYYNDIYKKYIWDFDWFRWLVNSKVQWHTRNMEKFWWTEIFISVKKGSWTFKLKDLQ
jgi:hypothetical protein